MKLNNQFFASIVLSASASHLFSGVDSNCLKGLPVSCCYKFSYMFMSICKKHCVLAFPMRSPLMKALTEEVKLIRIWCSYNAADKSNGIMWPLSSFKNAANSTSNLIVKVVGLLCKLNPFCCWSMITFLWRSWTDRRVPLTIFSKTPQE